MAHDPQKGQEANEQEEGLERSADRGYWVVKFLKAFGSGYPWTLQYSFHAGDPVRGLKM